jgi:hypothetical protein
MKKALNISRLLFVVTRPGFEPRQAEPESAVLPLYYRAIIKSICDAAAVFIISSKATSE